MIVVFDPSGGFVTGGGWFDKGSGTINGQGQYEFMLRAVDDDAGDTFRIRIWEEIAGVEVVMYDNGSQQPIGEGNILVQSGGGR
jgi:hypothetical protein